MLTPVEDVDGDRGIVVEARDVLTEGVRRIGDEVRNSLDFHVMQEGSSPVERVVLTGPAVAIPGFAEQIGQQIGLVVELGLVNEAKAGGFGGVDAGRLAVAAGLAVEEVSA
jgi:Tfp pilus assembly PilM family ATPase